MRRRKEEMGGKIEVEERGKRQRDGGRRVKHTH